MKKRSLRTRLIVIFTLLLVLAWAVSSAISYVKIRHRVRLIFDSEQIMFAQRLEQSQLSDLLKGGYSNERTAFKNGIYNQAREIFSFAIFSNDGKLLLSNVKNVADYNRSKGLLNLDNGPVFEENPLWRTLWLRSMDGQFIIAIGQKNAYRNMLSRRIVIDHALTPWAMILPIMLLIIILMINRELAPLKQMASSLQTRAPDDDTPLNDQRLPSEIKPFVDALNGLFAQIGNMLRRERRFVSDAAHELRSPLAALRVQAQVAQLAINKPEVQLRALNNLTLGIDRASRLIDQLLTLSKLDAEDSIPDPVVINWQQMVQEMQPSFFTQAQKNSLELKVSYQGTPPDSQGNLLLLSLLIRNLVDNALSYTQPGGEVSITLTNSAFIVEDSGPGVTEEQLIRLGERFYRPPGQTQTGSGLGISISQQIAGLHGLRLSFNNRDEGGFSARIEIG
ncbi:quorum sensing histidine kinase QseC [Budvicia diplopodorum]|uniref:quorum sensing histidine kinase QseC n=1 Tax=Budvicia diplopodorum TaxID=1119056 RepID=UPI00135B35D2|nr:quorum sensing histidine kinase QseC [Budvicia diplopodorum]